MESKINHLPHNGKMFGELSAICRPRNIEADSCFHLTLGQLLIRLLGYPDPDYQKLDALSAPPAQPLDDDGIEKE